MSTVLVVAPHPDDETLGCGGSILRHRNEGDDVHWLIATHVCAEIGYSNEKINARETEIRLISEKYGFAGLHRLNLNTTRLDTYPMADIVSSVSEIISQVEPEILYLPFRGDAHSDHKIVHDACMASSKWFRSPYIKEILMYETPSETDFQIDITSASFRPNRFVDVSLYIQQKLDLMTLYKGESGEYPFPRSREAIEALAKRRGVESGFMAAEAFMIVKSRY